MNRQNRYYYLLGTIVAIGISAYLFIFPNFETAEFDAVVIENISKGVTTTVVSNENNEEINEEIAVSEDIDIENENPTTVNKFLVNSTAEKDIENFTVYLLIGSDERSENSSESRGYVDGERADVIILGLVNDISGEKHLISIPRDVLISNPCTKEVTRINATYSKNNCGIKLKI